MQCRDFEGWVEREVPTVYGCHYPLHQISSSDTRKFNVTTFLLLETNVDKSCGFIMLLSKTAETVEFSCEDVI